MNLKSNNLNLKKIKAIHFTGIKGVGMTSLALIAQDLGKSISGSDLATVFPTDKILKTRKISYRRSFSEKNIPHSTDLLIFTGAHGGSSNKEVQEAIKRNIPILSHAQALGFFTKNHRTLAVAGVGGKSTTSAILATILSKANRFPSYAVGVGNIDALGVPGKASRKSNLFVVEADEYVTDPNHDLTPRFHHLNPFHAIITNIEHDHPDVYPTIKDTQTAFLKFIQSVPSNGLVIANQDNFQTKKLIKKTDKPVITYGFSPESDWQITKTHLADKKQFFNLKVNQLDLPTFTLNVPGNYNLSNAVAAIISAYNLGVPVDQIIKALKYFTGTNRRFEHIRSIKTIDLYDDYAHHPIEIKALLKAAKNWFIDKKIIIIFQSHTYSRTKTLIDQFASSFNDADTVIINDIFSSARETDTLGLTGKIFAEAISKHHRNTHYCPDKQSTLKYLSSNLESKSVILTVGAGDNWLWHKDIIRVMKSR